MQCRSDKISIDRYLHLKLDNLMSTAACSTHPLCIYVPPSRHLVWEKDKPCLLQVISAFDIYCDNCMNAPTIHIIQIRQFPGGGLVPLKHGSGSGPCQSILREGTTVHRATMYTQVVG